MAEKLIADFDALSHHERALALHAILSSLGPYEQRAVKAEFEEKKFHFDIIGSQNVQLPVEIILQITALLDLLDVVRSQRVSRSWQEVLTSWVVMDQAMEQWYDKSDPPLTCDRIPFDPAYTRKQKLDHIRRIRTCSPSAQASVEIPHHSDLRLLTTPNTQSDHVIFHDEVLAWRSTDTSKLMLLNVKKGINSFGCTQGREGIEEIFLTSRYAICSSLHGRLSAFDIARMDKDSLFLPVHASIRLPSISRRIRAVDDIVAILHTESLHNLDASYNVQIWNISENKSWSFRRSARDSKKSEVDIIPDNWQIHVESIFLHPPSERVTVLSATHESSFIFQTFNFSGELLNDNFARTLVLLPEILPSPPGQQPFVPPNAYFNPLLLADPVKIRATDRSQYRVQIALSQFPSSPSRPRSKYSHHNYALYFDGFTQTLTLIPRQSKMSSFAGDHSAGLAEWQCSSLKSIKDIDYNFAMSPSPGSWSSNQVEIICSYRDHFDTELKYKNTTMLATMSKDFLEPYLCAGRWFPTLTAFGNDRYVVLLNGDSILVLYFDPDIRLQPHHLQGWVESTRGIE